MASSTRQAASRSGGVPETAGLSGAPSRQRPSDEQFGVAVSRLDPGLTPATSESWVEVASQPSSSSLSSIGDDIVTTGLRVGSGPCPARRRRSHPQQPMPASFIVGHPANQAGATSSQEEYDETESEEDRVMTSSTEAIHPSASLLRQQTAVRAGVDAEPDSSDDDENATALGRPTNPPVFRPQPNAFSHPPSHLTHRHSTRSAQQYQQTSHSRPPMHSRPHYYRSHRGPPDFTSPSYQADNDAALRASLTTLLSCAAAARGLPKHGEGRSAGTSPGPGAGIVPSSQPMELRLVPESELMAESPPRLAASPASGATASKPGQQARTESNSSAPSAPCSNPGREREAGKTKRTASTAQSKPARAAMKKRTSAAAALLDGETETAPPPPPFFMSPTVLPWVVSAGVVVLVSVVGFGAGYVIGREVGRQESAFGLGSSAAGSAAAPNTSAAAVAAGCGSELVRSGPGGTLRRIRWGGVGRSVAA